MKSVGICNALLRVLLSVALVVSFTPIPASAGEDATGAGGSPSTSIGELGSALSEGSGEAALTGAAAIEVADAAADAGGASSGLLAKAAVLLSLLAKAATILPPMLRRLLAKVPMPHRPKAAKRAPRPPGKPPMRRTTRPSAPPAMSRHSRGSFTRSASSWPAGMFMLATSGAI